MTASKFGPTDQIGNVNHITPAKTLAASRFAISIVQPGQIAGSTLGSTKTTYNDDIIAGWVGIGSQLDGLGHIGVDNLYCNCNKATDFAITDGLKKLGVENVPAIATRGVLLDIAGYFNTDIVKEGTAINRAEIEGAMKRQGIKSIERGDVVLFYTGWLKLIGKDNKRFGSAAPGLGREGAKYLASLEVAMVGTDTWSFEVIRSRRTRAFLKSTRFLFRSTAFTYSRTSIPKRW